MDIIKFNSYTYPTKLEGGEIINGIENKMWIERFDEAGEFTFSGPVSSGIRETLPIGVYISHTNTAEVMLVENHEINEDKGSDPIITITGRGLENTLFEQRVVGSNKTFPVTGPFEDYTLAAAETWQQIVTLIEDHILTANTINDDDAIPYLTVLSEATGGEEEERALKVGYLYDHILTLLKEDGLGIKVVRPGPWSPLGATSDHIAIVIHQGADLSQDVVFSQDAGELISADYLWSMQWYKTAILVTSKWAQVMAYYPPTPLLAGHHRRMMFLDYTEVDQHLDVAPVGVAFDNLVLALEMKGRRTLYAQREVAMAKTEISKDALKAIYRVDYNVGDVITVRGDYNEESRMRVTEHVEIEDKTGEFSYPTLELEP